MKYNGKYGKWYPFEPKKDKHDITRFTVPELAVGKTHIIDHGNKLNEINSHELLNRSDAVLAITNGQLRFVKEDFKRPIYIKDEILKTDSDISLEDALIAIIELKEDICEVSCFNDSIKMDLKKLLLIFSKSMKEELNDRKENEI